MDDLLINGLLALRRQDFDAARTAFEAAAESGEGEALFHLGLLASNGQGEPEDPSRAADLYRRAADAGSRDACFNLGALHVLGRGVPRDPEAAVRWYGRAAELGDLEASFKAGVVLALEFDPPRLADAEARWVRCAHAGHAGATFFLGRLHADLGPTRDVAKAASYFLDGVELDDADALEGLKRVLPELQAAHAAGHGAASEALGRWHAVVQQDATTALGFLEIAVAQGDVRALTSLAWYLVHGEGLVADPDPELAPGRSRALLEKAVAAGDLIARFHLAVILMAPDDVSDEDAERAVELLRPVAEAGHVNAMADLGDALARLELDAEALRWFVRAAELGDAGAMFAAGDRYRDGIGCEVDLVQAARWFWSMLAEGDGDGIHEVLQLAPSMTDEKLRKAARLAGDATLVVGVRGAPEADGAPSV